MTAIPTPMPRARLTWRWQSPALLIIPLLVFQLFFFFAPAVKLLLFSLMTQSADGNIGTPWTLSHYWHFFSVALYSDVLWNTLRISVITSLIAAVLAYPVATVLVRGHALLARVLTLVIIAPLAVSVVVRAYGWQLILNNGPTGLLNYVLLHLGIIDRPNTLMFTDWAVIIASLQIFFPMMVLPLASALGKIDANLPFAARTLGAPPWQVFFRITFPLSLPGLVAGMTLVFSLAAGSYVIPALIGGPRAQMLGNLAEQQIVAVYDWPFGATIAAILVFIVIAVNTLSMKLLSGRRLPGAAK
ncbi:ABC transporter permease [Candidatus Pantoea formicae]|uniref:ABC transporter permease n=1 Tax=Candidatus Pantoea formicae TaxID=2608355 RepID=UPI003ED9BB7D